MALQKVVKVDEHLEAGGRPWVGRGMNDTVVVSYQTLISQGFTGYLGVNMLFPVHPADEKHPLLASTVEEFWWKYFWLCRYYGWNLVRTSDGWGYERMTDCFYNYRPFWDSMMKSMLKMASWNQVYISFGMGSIDLKGGGGTPGNKVYEDYVKFYGDIMPLYKDEPAIAFVEIANEPDGDGPYLDWWSKQGTTQADHWAAWRAWATAIVNAIHAKDHSHLTTMGTAVGAYMHGYDEAGFKDMNAHPCDVAHNHQYSKRTAYSWTQDDYEALQRKWANDLGKPLFIGEYNYDCWVGSWQPPGGYTLPAEYGGGNTASPQVFSPWMTQVYTEVGIDAMTAMQPPYYPNWPPTQAVLDAIPPVPSSDPNPLSAEGTFGYQLSAALALMLRASR